MNHCNNSFQLQNERILLDGGNGKEYVANYAAAVEREPAWGGLMSLQKVHHWDLIPEENRRPGGGECVSTDVYLIDREQCVGRNPREQLWIIKEAEIFIHGKKQPEPKTRFPMSPFRVWSRFPARRNPQCWINAYSQEMRHAPFIRNQLYTHLKNLGVNSIMYELIQHHGC